MCLQLMKEEDVDMKKIEEGRKGRKKCYIEITISKGNKKMLEPIFSMFVNCFLCTVLLVFFSL